MCGDSTLTGDETCDDGNTGSGDGCSDTCQLEPGWSCTGVTCTLLCGNGTLDASAGEQCDDGNTGTGDGCSGTCQVEAGWACEGTGAGSCVEIADHAACGSARTVTSATTITGENTLAGGARLAATGCGTGGETGGPSTTRSASRPGRGWTSRSPTAPRAICSSSGRPTAAPRAAGT
ncbi:MAG: DUF4215 domain-containing protein [Sandaracinaceae bacterium]|nr:DUF4215 domain-containing protein [Sandaracinaceae bacterium]